MPSKENSLNLTTLTTLNKGTKRKLSLSTTDAVTDASGNAQPPSQPPSQHVTKIQKISTPKPPPIDHAAGSGINNQPINRQAATTTDRAATTTTSNKGTKRKYENVIKPIDANQGAESAYSKSHPHNDLDSMEVFDPDHFIQTLAAMQLGPSKFELISRIERFLTESTLNDLGMEPCGKGHESLSKRLKLPKAKAEEVEEDDAMMLKSYTPLSIAAMAIGIDINGLEADGLRDKMNLLVTAEALKDNSPTLELMGSIDNSGNNWHQQFKSADAIMRLQMIEVLVENYITTVLYVLPNTGRPVMKSCSSSIVVSGDLKQALVDHLETQLCCLMVTCLKEDAVYIASSAITRLEAVNHIAVAFANRTTVVDANAILTMM